MVKTMFWLQLVIGIWLLISPWLFDFSSNSLMKWNNVIIGTALILASLWALFVEEKPKV